MSPISSAREPVLYKSATVTRLTGYSALVLRAWERRHDLLEPVRTPSGHRLYTEQDLQVLQAVRELTSQGLTIGEVAAMGRPAILARQANRSAPACPSPVRALSVVSQPQAPEVSAAIIRSAMVLDEEGIRAALDDGFSHFDEARMIDEVITPALTEVGALWAEGRIGVAAENILSLIVRQRLLARIEAASHEVDPSRSPVICACVEPEAHDIGALVLSLALLRAEVPVLYLGPSIPFDDLDTACHLRNPAAVCLSYKTGENIASSTARLSDLVRRHPTVLFIVGGAGVETAAVTDLSNLRFSQHTPLSDVVQKVVQHVGSGLPEGSGLRVPQFP